MEQNSLNSVERSSESAESLARPHRCLDRCADRPNRRSLIPYGCGDANFGISRRVRKKGPLHRHFSATALIGRLAVQYEVSST